MSLDRFMELFQGRADTFAQQHSDGSYTPVRRPITREDYIAHGKGEVTYGIYTVNNVDGCTKFIVWDIDSNVYGDVYQIEKALVSFGIQLTHVLVELSGRKGWHVWLPFDGWFDAELAYRAARAVLQKSGVQCEAFPKQPHIGEGFGNLIKLPLGVHQVSGKQSEFIYGGGPEHWSEVKPISFEQLEKLANLYEEPAVRERPPFRVASSMPGSVGLPPCMQRVLQDGVGEGKRDVALFSLAVESKRQGKTEDEAIELLLEANDKFDPPFAEYVLKQKVRSAYSKPYAGIKCEMGWLHESTNPLCSTGCPRYQREFGAATLDPKGGRDNHLSSGSSGATAFPLGSRLELTVESSFVRGDGRTVYVLSHPEFTNNPVGVV